MITPVFYSLQATTRIVWWHTDWCAPLYLIWRNWPRLLCTAHGQNRELLNRPTIVREFFQFAASWLARISCQRRGRLLYCKTFLRKRIHFGVISTNSSSPIHSIACSRLSSPSATLLT